MRACSGLYTAGKRNQGFRSFLHRLVPSSRAGNMSKRGPGEEGRAAPPHGEKRKAHGLFKTLFHLPSRVRKNNPDTAPPVARRRRPPCRAFSSGDRFLHRCSSGNSRRFRREVHRGIALRGNGSGESGAGRLSVFISDTGIFLRSAPGRELGAVSVFLGGAESSGADVRRDACMAGPAAGGGATAASEFFRITSCNRVGQVVAPRKSHRSAAPPRALPPLRFVPTAPCIGLFGKDLCRNEA